MAIARHAGENAHAALSTMLRWLMYIGTPYMFLQLSGIVCTCTLDLALCTLGT